MFNIEEELKKLPNKPGVYIMHDKDDNIIYVGKAVSLKNRVRQYFRKNKKTKRIENMVSLVDYFEYIVTDNEAEALILECNLIKKNMPKFNVLLKDDKTYPYIKVNVKADYPDVYITRKILNDGSKYFGPYANAGAAKEMVDFIKDKFKIRQCKNFKYKDRPCLNYQIKKCFAPCMGYISKEEYRKQIDEIFIPMISDEYIIGINTLDYLIEQDSATIIDFYNETVAAINEGRRLLLSQSNGYSEFIYFYAENDTLTLCYKHYGYPNQERIATSTITSTGEVSNITDVCLQADVKTDNMTLAVGVDSYGKLYATMPTLSDLGASAIPRITSVTLLAANWTGTANPYSQVIEVPTVTENTKVDLQPTAQQIVDLQNQDIQLMVENDNGTCTCYAIGAKPSTDLEMRVMLTEVVEV